MWPILVVFPLPMFELAGEILPAPAGSAFLKFFSVGLVAPLNLSVYLRATWRNVVVRDAEIGEVPGELRPKGRVVVCLNPVDREGEMLSDFLQELDGGLGVVVIVDAENSKSRRFVDRRELIETLTRTSHWRNKFHVELHRAPRNLQWSIGGLGPRAILHQVRTSQM